MRGFGSSLEQISEKQAANGRGLVSMSANDPKRTFRELLVGFGILFSDKL